MAASKPLVVGAIDFGTTYSGWAFSMLHEFQSDPTKATVNTWNNGVSIAEKTPTCVLIGPDKKFVAFGYKAEDMYKDLVEEETYRQYYYFKRFKMILSKKLGEKIDRNITLEDEMGNSLPAVLVFSMAIKYLVDDMLEVGNDRQSGLLVMDDVHWVLTVPAIWTDAAKQFMRLAANKAGIKDKKLTFALEPEAASLYCRHLSMEKTVDRSKVSISQFKAGTRYMILDAGGGTVDITVHEITGGGDIKEVQAASGGGWGGILVDKAFEDLIIDIFTPDIYEDFKKNETEDWLDFWRNFEVKKRNVNLDDSSRITMKFPAMLISMYTKSTGIEMQERIAQLQYTGVIAVTNDKYKFDAQFFRKSFETSIQKTVRHVKGILQHGSVKAILMVGGFSESPVFQHAMKSAFAGKGIDFIIPSGASSVILRGALIYGHSPMSISERVLKYTYGVKGRTRFIEGVHPEKYRVETDKGPRCRNHFSKHVEMNQTVMVGEPQVMKTYTPTDKYQRYRSYPIYASTQKNPQYVDDEGCTYIGKLEFEVLDPDDDLDRETDVSLTFSGTEIMVEAFDRKTGTNYSTTLDFLG